MSGRRALKIQTDGGYASFDYAILEDQDLAADAKAAAARIRGHQRAALVDIGRELLAMKERLGHGHFIKWIEGETDISRRTATRMMMVATRFGDQAKWATVSHLPTKLLYDLAAESTPEAIREAALAVEPGKRITPYALKATINQARVQDIRAKRRQGQDNGAAEAKADAERAKREERAKALAARMFKAGLVERVDEFLTLKQKGRETVLSRYEAGDCPDLKEAIRMANGGGMSAASLTSEFYTVKEEVLRLRWAAVANLIVDAIGDRMPEIVEAAKGLGSIYSPNLHALLTLP